MQEITQISYQKKVQKTWMTLNNSLKTINFLWLIQALLYLQLWKQPDINEGEQGRESSKSVTVIQ